MKNLIMDKIKDGTDLRNRYNIKILNVLVIIHCIQFECIFNHW